MDQNREIRFLIPPFFLLASLLLGAFLDLSIRPNVEKLLTLDSAERVLGVLAAGSVAVIPLGFLIGSISVFLVRIFFGFKRSNYEATLSDDCLKRIWAQLNTDQKFNQKLTFYAAATFDHEVLDKGIHEWIMRRWNSFNVSIHSCTALLLAHLFGGVFLIGQDPRWLLLTFVLVLILFANGATAWRETMGMLDFQSHRSQNKQAMPADELQSYS